jgi:hypothetical protein
MTFTSVYFRFLSPRCRFHITEMSISYQTSTVTRSSLENFWSPRATRATWPLASSRSISPPASFCFLALPVHSSTSCINRRGECLAEVDAFRNYERQAAQNAATFGYVSRDDTLGSSRALWAFALSGRARSTNPSMWSRLPIPSSEAAPRSNAAARSRVCTHSVRALVSIISARCTLGPSSSRVGLE